MLNLIWGNLEISRDNGRKYISNNNGPSTDTRGTLNISRNSSDFTSFINIHYV